MANAILGLHAQTAIHAGASASSGVIDLPIQREAHTGWPCVYGSGVKGALRTRAEEIKPDWIDDVFGPPTGNAGDHAGALAVGDARLLLLPVRSLTTHFKWATCPALLRRAAQDCDRLGLSAQPFAYTEPADDNEIVVPQSAQNQQQNPQNQAQAKLFLEEWSFTPQPQDLARLISFLAQFMAASDAAKVLGAQLAIVSDNVFTHLARFATPVAAHVAIDNITKTVKTGALWYEESLPPETVFYVCLAANPSRKEHKDADGGRIAGPDAQAMLDCVTNDLFEASPYLQIGGNETVGMGWCHVKVLSPAPANAQGGQ